MLLVVWVFVINRYFEGWKELFGERWFTVKVISLAGITYDHETEMLILTMYLKKYLKVSNTLQIYLAICLVKTKVQKQKLVHQNV